MAIEYKKLKEILQKTLGVPLFQEQARQIAVVGADGVADHRAFPELLGQLHTQQGVGPFHLVVDRFSEMQERLEEARASVAAAE